MTRQTLLVLLGVLAACGSRAEQCPPGASATTIASTDLNGPGVNAHNLDGFEPPFGWVPLSEEYARARGVRAVTLHHDVDVEEGRFRDQRLETFVYDTQGRLQSRRLFDRGELSETVENSYEAGRLTREAHGFPRHPAADWSLTHAYDAKGRRSEVIHRSQGESFSKLFHYDSSGQLTRITRTGDDGGELVRTYEQGRLVLEELVAGTLSSRLSYDAAGRLSRRVTENDGGRVDSYAFAYDDAGRLSSLAFAENEKPIYRRQYTYDGDGMLIHERLESFVPAMGNGTQIRYEYERHSEPKSLAVVPAKKQPSHLEIVEAVTGAFPGSYAELATVRFEYVGGKQLGLKEVTFFVPEKALEKQSDQALKRSACAAMTALGYDCTCESVTRGQVTDSLWTAFPDKRVVLVTFEPMLGC